MTLTQNLETNSSRLYAGNNLHRNLRPQTLSELSGIKPLLPTRIYSVLEHRKSEKSAINSLRG